MAVVLNAPLAIHCKTWTECVLGAYGEIPELLKKEKSIKRNNAMYWYLELSHTDLQELVKFLGSFRLIHREEPDMSGDTIQVTPYGMITIPRNSTLRDGNRHETFTIGRYGLPSAYNLSYLVQPSMPVDIRDLMPDGAYLVGEFR